MKNLVLIYLNGVKLIAEIECEILKEDSTTYNKISTKNLVGIFKLGDFMTVPNIFDKKIIKELSFAKFNI